MNKRVKALVDVARKLTPAEQLELSAALAAEAASRDVTPPDDDDPADGTPEGIEAAWLDEVERRAAALERGETKLVDADVVFARIQARLDAAKNSDACSFASTNTPRRSWMRPPTTTGSSSRIYPTT